MSTALDVITQALWDIGELAQGQSPSPEDAQYCLGRLNLFMDMLSQDEAFIYTRSTAAYQLSVGVGAYQIGPTAASPFNVARPTKIDLARILALVAGQYVGVKVLDIINYKTYVQYSDKTSTSIIPETLYYDNAAPNGTLYLFDLPSSGFTKLELTSWVQLPQFTLTTVINLPQGYPELLVSGLSVSIAPGYSKTVDPVIVARAMQASQAIKNINRMILSPGMPSPQVLPPAS